MQVKGWSVSMLNDFPIHHELYALHLTAHRCDLGLCIPLALQNYIIQASFAMSQTVCIPRSTSSHGGLTPRTRSIICISGNGQY